MLVSRRVSPPSAFFILPTVSDRGRVGRDLAFDHGQEQHEGMHWLSQVVACRGQESRFGPIGALGFGLGRDDFDLGLLLPG